MPPTRSLLLGVALTVCVGAASPLAAGTLFQDQLLIHDGIERSFHYYIPDDLPAGPVPLVLALHGGGGSADQMTGLTGHKAPWGLFMEIAESEKFLVAYPDGVGNQWNDCRGDAPPTGSADDAGFLGAVIDWIDGRFDLDAERIYATGVSNGGLMSYRLGRELSDRIAAIAPVVANRAAADGECPAPGAPTSILILDGTADPLIPWQGGAINGRDRGTVESVETTIDSWLAWNGCSAAHRDKTLPDTVPADDSFITIVGYTDCPEGAEVVLYAVRGGGHTLPSSRERYSFLYELIVGKQNHDIEGAEEIWRFFRRHTLTGVPRPPQ